MTEDEASQVVVSNLKAMGYKPPSDQMKKRVEAALGVSVPLWRRASKPRQEEMFMHMHRAIEAADAAGPQAVNADLLAALRTVLDQVDYMADPPNCRLNEMVGAVLPQEVIALARAAIARADPPGTDQGKDAT